MPTSLTIIFGALLSILNLSQFHAYQLVSFVIVIWQIARCLPIKKLFMEWKKLIIIDSVKLSTTGYKQPLRKEENSKSYEFAVVYFTTLCVFLQLDG